MTATVRWRESVETMKKEGVSRIFELGAGKVLAGLTKRIGQAADTADDAFEIRALLAEILRALRIVPDGRVFELARDFLEAL